MRTGRTFKRCSRCGARVPDRRCVCGSESYSWGYVVDVNAAGAKRDQRRGSNFTTKRAAQDAMSRLQIETTDGTHIEPIKLTVGQYLDQWIVGLRGSDGVRTSTIKAYEVAVRRHINPRIGDIPLQQLKPTQVEALYDSIRAEPNAKDGRRLSPKSVFNIHLAFHKALDGALRKNLIRTNPADRACAAPANKPEMKYWSGEELRTFLAAVADDDHAVLWRLAAATGMRRGELLGLRWRDIDVTRRRLSVRQQLVHARRETFGEPKTAAGKRSIPIDPSTMASLEALQRSQSKDKLELGAGYKSNLDLVFCRTDGSPLDPDVITHQFQRLASRARVPVIRLHDLRHTCATLMLSAGYHAKVVQERLGHSSIKVTLDLYGHTVPAMQEQAASWIADVVDVPFGTSG